MRVSALYRALRAESNMPFISAGWLIIFTCIISVNLPFYVLGFFRIPETNRYNYVWYIFVVCVIYGLSLFYLCKRIVQLWSKSSVRAHIAYHGLIILVVIFLVGGVIFYRPIFKAYGQGFADYLKNRADFTSIRAWLGSQDIPAGKARTLSKSQWPDFIKDIAPCSIKLVSDKQGTTAHLQWHHNASWFELVIQSKPIHMPEPDHCDESTFIYNINEFAYLTYDYDI